MLFVLVHGVNLKVLIVTVTTILKNSETDFLESELTGSYSNLSFFSIFSLFF